MSNVNMQPICISNLYSLATFTFKHCHAWREMNFSSQTRLREWGMNTNKMMKAGLPSSQSPHLPQSPWTVDRRMSLVVLYIFLIINKKERQKSTVYWLYYQLLSMHQKPDISYYSDLHCCLKTIKHILLSHSFALGDMFLHHQEHTHIFFS